MPTRSVCAHEVSVCHPHPLAAPAPSHTILHPRSPHDPPAPTNLLPPPAHRGLYRNASEGVREALRCTRERDEERLVKLEAIRQAVAVGLSQVESEFVLSPAAMRDLEGITAYVSERIAHATHRQRKYIRPPRLNRDDQMASPR
jgi:antitoxin ParD1/3/4